MADQILENGVRCNQFQGCLLGGLVGDALGAPFENEFEHQYSNSKIQQFVDGLASPQSEKLTYTDETSMTQSVIHELLLEGPTINLQQVARRFADTYSAEKKEPRDRNYGAETLEIFEVLEKSYFTDILLPAIDLNRGQGSFSNGAGGHISPVTLMTILDESVDSLVEFTVDCARITHANPMAIMGAIFQAMAIRQALLFGKNLKGQPGADLAIKILNEFSKDFESLRKGQFKDYFLDNLISHKALSMYKFKIDDMRQLLTKGKFEVKEVKDILGVKSTALDSIPTAFFCFLASFKPIHFIETTNQYQRTIQLAICCGGDTDTIASMAGNIAGAFLGSDSIPPHFQEQCEGSRQITELAQTFFTRMVKNWTL